jgi:hypothetical protein
MGKTQIFEFLGLFVKISLLVLLVLLVGVACGRGGRTLELRRNGENPKFEKERKLLFF